MRSDWRGRAPWKAALGISGSWMSVNADLEVTEYDTSPCVQRNSGQQGGGAVETALAGSVCILL